MNIRQKSIPLKDVRMEDKFFSPILSRIAAVTVPDVLYKFEHDRGGAINNYDRVRDNVQNEHAGPEWYDGLTCETITGISDLLVHYYDSVTDLHMDNYAARIAAAALRDSDGYINTHTQTMEPDHRFGADGGFLRGQHDVYNAGCLVEAGVHHYIATKKTVLLDPAVKFACYLCDLIGTKPKKNIVPAHSLPEGAMIELFRLFRDNPELGVRYPEAGNGERFLELAEFWVENRGNHCGLPDWESWEYQESEKFIKECRYGGERPCWGEYAQDKVPVFEQESIEGHAVRAVLLFTGVAACAYENDRTDYIDTAVRIWDSMALRRMHVTGGVGAIHNDEKFGKDFFLPEDAYLETCAAIGAIFYSHSMYLLTGQKKYMDCLETILYNGALAGVSHDGTHYSYINPLVSDGSIHRWDWHQCPCCPPMDLKLYGKMPQFIYSYTEDSITVNLHTGSSAVIPVSGTKVRIKQTGGYPWKGDQKIIFENSCPTEITLRMRIPDWCSKWKLSLNGQEGIWEMQDGYALLKRQFAKGDVVELKMDMPVMAGFGHPDSEECLGKAVLRRGPVIYCVEETDQTEGMDFVIGKNTKLGEHHDPFFLGGADRLTGTDDNGRTIHAIPYYLWDNRESGKLKVWLDSVLPKPDADWDKCLYSYVPISEWQDL